MSTPRILKWITGSFEVVLGIPILGAIVIVGFSWVPLMIMLALHITTLVITKKEGGSVTGSILGIIASCLGIIPIVGWAMHVVTAIVLMLDAAKPERVSREYI